LRKNRDSATPASANPSSKPSSRPSAVPPISPTETRAIFFDPERNVSPKRGEININGPSQVIGFMKKAELLNLPLLNAERFVELKYLQAAGVK
jgi:hypothetical protein